MAQNRFYSSVYPPTTLSAAITSAVATSCQVASVTGAPGSFPFTMLIDWGLTTQEAVSVTAISGTGPFTLTITRGIDGTTAQTHVNGAVIVHGVSAEDYNEPQVHMAAAAGVHGVTGSVVGTTDTQTLTNKTLGATTFSGAITESMASATGGVIKVTNTTAAPSAPNVQWQAAAAADSQLGVKVSGDTTNRVQMDSNGKMQWGAGGVAAVDADLYRNAAGEMKTDNSLTVVSNFTVGGAQLLAGGSGVMGVNNATTAPTTTPAGGYVAYGKSGFAKYRGADGLDYGEGTYNAYLATAFTGTTAGSYVTITGLTAAIGIGTYRFHGWALFSQAATTGTVAFAVNGPATSVLAYSVEQNLAGTTTLAAVTAYNSGTATGTLTAATNYLVKIFGLLTSTAAGTLAMTYNASAVGTFSVLAGSYLNVSPVV